VLSANPFIAEHQLDGRFVVMYSGNHSLSSPVTTLVEAAVALCDDPRFVFVFVGGGLGKRAVDEAIARHPQQNIVSLPYQPLAQIKVSLSAADVHVVTLGNHMAGIIHPCKIYGAMAIGRPVLVIGPRPSHASDLVERHQVGWRVDQGDVPGAIAALRSMVEMPSADLQAMGERGRHAVREHYSKDRLCAALCDIVERAARVASGESRVARSEEGTEGAGGWGLGAGAARSEEAPTGYPASEDRGARSDGLGAWSSGEVA
jgi:glycosyltransferase involved in cell wall biosynthesis